MVLKSLESSVEIVFKPFITVLLPLYEINLCPLL